MEISMLTHKKLNSPLINQKASDFHKMTVSQCGRTV